MTASDPSAVRISTLLRSQLDATPDALLLIDGNGNIRYANTFAEALFGYAAGELIGLPVETLMPTRYRERHVGNRDAFIASPQARAMGSGIDFTARHKDGSEFPVDIMLTPLPGSPDEAVAVRVRDLSVQRRLEAELRQRNADLTATTALLNNILDSSTEYAIVAYDLDGNTVTWNNGAVRLYGYTADQAIGGRLRRESLHTPQDVGGGRIAQLYETVRRTGKAEGNFPCVRSDGAQFLASLSVTLRRETDGTPVGFLAVSRDITAQKQMEERIARKNEELNAQYLRMQETGRLKNEFLANMSHELRTPLNAIIGFSEILHDGRVGVLAPDHREYVGDILSSARHLQQLINDVLDLARIDAGRTEFRPVPLDIGRITGELREIVRSRLAEKRLHLDIEVDPTLTDIVADPARLKQVIYNYLSNAIKFSPEEGRIAVRAMAVDDHRFRVEVEDRGVGIGAEEIAHLFVEFRLLDGGLARRHQGSGLGLALTRRVVEAQGGSVGVDSTPGKGSLFYAILPRRPGTAVKTAPTPARIKAGGDGTPILVVEDDPRDRDWITQVLSRAGYAVDAAADGAQALALCRQRSYAAVTLDLLLPDMTGWELLRAMRLHGPNTATPAVVLSVVADRAAGSAFAIRDYLVKPAEASDLLAALRRAGVVTPLHRKVVVLDADDAALKSMAEKLRRNGYETYGSGSPEEALMLVQQHSPDALIVDLQFNGGDGFTFLSQLRDCPAGRRLPVFVCTGKALGGDDAQRLCGIAKAVLDKSEDAGQRLLAELGSTLDGPGDVPAHH